MNKYTVIDLETSGVTTRKRFCNQFEEGHSVTMIGIKERGDFTGALVNQDYKKGFTSQLTAKHIMMYVDDSKFVCGHNVKFDLLWFWGQAEFQTWIKDGGKVWDTLTVQYLLDAQLGLLFLLRLPLSSPLCSPT